MTNGDEKANPYNSPSGTDSTKRWPIGFLDVLGLMAGITVALALAMFAMQLQRESDDPAFAYRIYMISLFLLGGSIGGFIQRCRSKPVGKGFVVGGFALFLFRAFKWLHGIPIP